MKGSVFKIVVLTWIGVQAILAGIGAVAVIRWAGSNFSEGNFVMQRPIWSVIGLFVIPFAMTTAMIGFDNLNRTSLRRLLPAVLGTISAFLLIAGLTWRSGKAPADSVIVGVTLTCFGLLGMATAQLIQSRAKPEPSADSTTER